MSQNPSALSGSQTVYSETFIWRLPITQGEFTSGSSLAGQYEIVREIGRGGMATVYLAEDRKHDRQVAVKVLLPELSEAIGAARFTREIRTVARLRHPHILPLYDSGAADGLLFFVMPLVDGESVRDLLNREASVALEKVARIIRHIGDALDYAHSQGVVHRDLKPENILLSGGEALLVDFGVARATKERAGSLTSEGTTLGTPNYMSPEQASGEPQIDGRSDLYSLGCITYELLAGRKPFTGSNTMSIIAQHITRSAPPLIGSREPVGEDVADAVAKMLSKDPADRFSTASAFATVLENAVTSALHPERQGERLKLEGTEARRKPAVFVIDFTNLTSSVDIDWLSGGIAETVSVDLKRVGGIRVVGSDPGARQRITKAKAAGPIDAQVARELGKSVGARWVVWGGFQKAGNRLRLTPQFSEVESGEIVSVEKIDGSMDEIFELQDRIVTRLAGILQIELTTGEAELIAKRETAQLSAYELYARGKQAFLVFGRESSKAAYAYYKQATEIDPDYALAWTGLGSLLMPRYIASGDPAVLDEGVKALQRAMELDPSLGEPYVFLCYMYGHQHRFDAAVAAGKTAIERDPGGFMSWYVLGLALLSHALVKFHLSDIRRSMLVLLRSRSINPGFHPAQLVAGWLYALRGEYEHATIVADEAVAVERAGVGHQFIGTYILRAMLHLNSGEMTEARSLLDFAIRTYTTLDHVYAETMSAWAHCMRGRLAEFEADYDAMEHHHASAIDIAVRNDHRLGIGAHWVKSKLGLARSAQRRSQGDRSDRLLAEATGMFETRSRFIWVPIAGASDAEVLYEVAATHAVRGDRDLAIATLSCAADAGWSDVNQLAADPCFAGIRESETVVQLLAEALTRVTLPSPASSGGLPEFTE